MKQLFRNLQTGFSNIRVSGKLVICYLFTIFLPLSILFGALLTNLNNSFRIQYLAEKKYMLEQADNLFDGVQVQTDYMVSTLENNNAFILFMVGGYRNAADEIYGLLREINPTFERFFMSSSALRSICVYRYQESHIKDTKHVLPASASTYGEAGLRAFAYGERRLDFCLSEGELLMDVYLPVWRGGTTMNVGVCKSTVDITDLAESVAVLPSEVFVMEANGVYLQRDSQGAFSVITEEEFQALPGSRVNSNSSDSGITLHIITTKSFLGEWDVLFQAALFLLALLFVSLVFYAIPVVLVRPILKLAKHMDSIDDSGLLQPFAIPHGTDEVGKLIESYNRMAERNNQLTTEVFKSIEARQRSEYYALQSQIKPHFMLNVLQRINMLTYLDKKDEISRLLEKFGNFMRYSINWNADTMTLKDEIAHVYNYLELMAGSAHVVFDSEIEPGIEPGEVLCPQFILQPVVENALKYNGDKEIQVKLSVTRQAGYLLVCLWNSGKAIADETLKQIESKLSKDVYVTVVEEGNSTGIGLHNVNTRLRFFYGAGCGLDISNMDTGGVMVTLRLRECTEEG